MSFKAPEAPDYKGAAEATAAGSHANQIGPWGSTMWTQETGPQKYDAQGNPVNMGPGTWTSTTTLDPRLQGALDDQFALQGDRSELARQLFGQASGAMGSPLDFSGAPTVGNGAEARQRAEDAIYQRQASRLDPMWAQQEESQRARLAAQGLDPSSEAGAADMGIFGRARNDAYSGAMQQAIMGGGQEASRQQGLDMNARQQFISELLQKRSQPLNEINALMGGQQVQMPKFPGAPPGADYLGAAGMQGRDQMAQYQAMMQMFAALAGGGMSLLGAGLR